MTLEPHPELDEPAEGSRPVMDFVHLADDLGKASPEVRAAVMRLLATRGSERARLQPAGRARKVSVSMPEDLTAAVQQRVGRGDFSRYVTEAVTRQLELDLLGELAALLEDEHGPVSDQDLAEARLAWPDAE